MSRGLPHKEGVLLNPLRRLPNPSHLAFLADHSAPTHPIVSGSSLRPRRDGRLGFPHQAGFPLRHGLLPEIWIRERWVLRDRAGLAPARDPKSEARGGAGVAVNKVKKYLAKMVRAVDYDFYDDDDLRYVRFKSPFNRRPLIGRRPPLGKNAGKRTLRLVGSSSPDYLRQCEEAAFGDFDDSDDWEGEV
ncbi:uncharacterized protein C2845_PM16G15600 [Panicum miliaceum]|uniref:Uncharacterized protein n=1 Tax=Panicum miliaceum TaxID=4540 RepID=A0A3L6PWS7_PANMI|nr:uncharacterized protein C2845_PM16G15600 [Panicum miliaceum]